MNRSVSSPSGARYGHRESRSRRASWDRASASSQSALRPANSAGSRGLEVVDAGARPEHPGQVLLDGAVQGLDVRLRRQDPLEPRLDVADDTRQPVGQLAEEDLAEGRPGRVVLLPALGGPGGRAGQKGTGEADVLTRDHHVDGPRARRLPGPHGRGEDVRHHRLPLDPGGGRRFLRHGRDPGTEPADGGQQHAGLPQAGQDLADVLEEDRAGADDQDTAALQPGVGVEQVGGAVQGHDGLAGARTPLDDQHARVR
ncbi:hypothetical protein OHV13_34380 [Kitasatospora purpeofusca]|uniref:hypothetical protein n=1 Tax=Kitasatospora purpeofusca TaxID=67352 RepID=UPI003255E5AF